MCSIPKHLAEKAAGFPESSYGACNVCLILESGTVITEVILAWGGDIIRINGAPITSSKDLNFEVTDLVDVIPA